MLKNVRRQLCALGAAVLCCPGAAWAQSVGEYVYTYIDGRYLGAVLTAPDEVSLGTGGTNIAFYTMTGTYVIPDTMTFTYYDFSIHEESSKLYRITGISERCFDMAPRLDHIVIPEGIKTIGSRAFYTAGQTGSTGTADLVLPSTLTEIAEDAFLFCYMYKSIDFSQSQVTVIPEGCCSNMYNLKGVTIGSKITEIGMQAFQGSSLEEVTIPSNVSLIKADAFRNNKLRKIVFEGDQTWLDTEPNRMGYVYTFSEQQYDDDNKTILPDILNVPYYMSYHFKSRNGYTSVSQYIDFYYQPTAEWQTFTSLLNMEFDAQAYADGLRVYTVTGIDAATGRVVLRENEPTVAGHLLLYGSECYVLKATPGMKYHMERENTAVSTRWDSYLRGDGTVNVNTGMAATDVEPTVTIDGVEYTNMVLQDGRFVKLATTTSLPYGQAYLSVPTSEIQTVIDGSSAPRLSLGLGIASTTGIRPVGPDNDVPTYYDLSGRRVAHPTKGVYIVNGKKIMIR